MTALITLEDYKAYKGITKTDSDEKLSLIIGSVDALVKNYCGHSFIDYYTTPKVEYFNINPAQDAIFLNEWPVRTVSLVESRSSNTESYTTVDSVDYYVDPSHDTIYYHNGYWPEGKGAVKVTYTAGNSVPPADIKIACLDLVHHYFKEEYKESKTIGAVNVNNSSSMGKTTTASSTWPGHILRVLNLYQNG